MTIATSFAICCEDEDSRAGTGRSALADPSFTTRAKYNQALLSALQPSLNMKLSVIRESPCPRQVRARACALDGATSISNAWARPLA